MSATIFFDMEENGVTHNYQISATLNGWAGGRYWINKLTVVGRSNLAFELLAGKGSYGNKLDPWA